MKIKIYINYKFVCGFLLKLNLFSQPKEKHRLKDVREQCPGEKFGSKQEEATGGWRKLHNEVFHNFYSSRD